MAKVEVSIARKYLNIKKVLIAYSYLYNRIVYLKKNYLVGFFRLLMLAVVFNYTNHISQTPLSLIYNIISYLNGRFLGVMRIIST